MYQIYIKIAIVNSNPSLESDLYWICMVIDDQFRLAWNPNRQQFDSGPLIAQAYTLVDHLKGILAGHL